MTQLGTENELFKKFQAFRDDIMKCQSIAEVTEVRKTMAPYIAKTPQEGGFKLDLRKILDNCFKIKEAELYGEATPKTDMNTQNISKDMQPEKKETAPTKSQPTTTVLGIAGYSGAEEVTLPPAPLSAPEGSGSVESETLTGRAKEISEEMKDIDAENFAGSSNVGSNGPDIVTPSGVAQEIKPVEDKGQADLQKEVMTSEVKTRSRKEKPTEESTIEYIPRSQKSVKVFRRINVSINGVAYTNNEIGYEIVADTREEALEEAKALRESSLADIRELNELMNVKPSTQTTPTQTVHVVETPKTTPEVSKTPITVKDAQDVFPDANSVRSGISGSCDADKVKKAVAKKNPTGLNPGHEFDLYNLERLRALFTILRSVDDVEVKLPDGGGMLLGTYITQETQKFGASFPMAK